MSRFEDRHPVWASVLGGVAGLAIWWLVFNLLLILGYWVVGPARAEGKTSFLVEWGWLICGGPVCVVLGAWWPHGAGRWFRRPKSELSASQPAVAPAARASESPA